jgi:23S rRNA (adenine2503-C2)-methyltransferase
VQETAASLRVTPGSRLRAVLELSPLELRDWLAAQGEPALRAKQIRYWLLTGGAESFDQMTDLPMALRTNLTATFVPLGASIARHLEAADGTHKLLLRLADDRLIECVLIQEDGRRTACISTQVGCGMGCVFCASGLDGVDRNLSMGEILEQLIRLRNLPARRSAGTGPDRLTHIVVMGMGEPLANLDNLLAALAVATAKDGLGIGARHITISTVGLPKRIRQLADTGKQYHLAVSLHAPNDELRSRIVPTNPRMGLESILQASDYFHERTGRQVTFEYVLLGGLNDGVAEARALTQLLRTRQAHVNLIPFNDVAGLPYRRPTQQAVEDFVTVLRQQRISVKVRKRKGSEIDAACGQLRRTFAQAV